MTIQDILISFGAALIIFTICIGFFALNIMGGGDVKLIPIVALWAGPTHILQYLLITSMAGGVLAIVIIAKNHIKSLKYFKSSENINLSVAQKKDSAVPYGIGIAIGGLYVAYQLFTSFEYKTT